MNRCPNPSRLWIAVALALPLTVIGTVGLLNAQTGIPRPGGGMPKPPQFPPPPKMEFPKITPPKFEPPKFEVPKLNPPKFETVWKCSKCGQVLGTGNTQPALASCPKCSARFIN